MKNLLVSFLLFNCASVFAQSSSNPITEDDIDTYYYEYSSVVAAEEMDNNLNPIGEQDNFSLPEGGTELNIIISNEEPLMTKKLTLDIYFKEFNSDKEEDLIETLTMDIKPEWVVATTKYKFTREGEYIIDVYTESGVYVNTAYLSFTKD
ncbi:MAG: hypothetical protein LC105_00660 [Chitinophagales bacterium]|nr:hypothetical protein [Chitinophagales bacterium]MCZ2392356.1 hypothetical protein [Chitinophagales bacterium]